MNNRISIPTIDNPEFIDLEPFDINPLMSKCNIKVLYIGENRNGSVISKEVATNMSKTLRGCPIIGTFSSEKKDFEDHGDRLIEAGGGVIVEKVTRPYGFVAPDAKVWFQFFEDIDAFGNTQVREYLMAEGYLWTGQYEDCGQALLNENPQSMELDVNSLKGYIDSETKFFIISDATFSSLCILGQDVEPCFEGAKFFSAESENFMTELLSMAKELKFALENQKEEKSMSKDVRVETEFEEIGGGEGSETSTPTPVVPSGGETSPAPATSENGGVVAPPTPVVPTPAEVDGVKLTAADNDIVANLTDEYKEEGETKAEALVKDGATNVEKEVKKIETDFEEKEEVVEENTEYELLKAEYAALQTKFNLLEEQNAELLKFKKEIEEKEKDELIASFYMLSDEDKKEVVENKANYSLKEIKAELSMICVDKKVNFSLAKEQVGQNMGLTVNLNAHQAETLPAWLRAVQNFKEKID